MRLLGLRWTSGWLWAEALVKDNFPGWLLSYTQGGDDDNDNVWLLWWRWCSWWWKWWWWWCIYIAVKDYFSVWPLSVAITSKLNQLLGDSLLYLCVVPLLYQGTLITTFLVAMTLPFAHDQLTMNKTKSNITDNTTFPSQLIITHQDHNSNRSLHQVPPSYSSSLHGKPGRIQVDQHHWSVKMVAGIIDAKIF